MEKRYSQMWCAGKIGEKASSRWFDTEAEAMEYVVKLASSRLDAKGLEAGDYFVDAPAGIGG